MAAPLHRRDEAPPAPSRSPTWLIRLALALCFVFGLLTTSVGSPARSEGKGDPIAEEAEDGEAIGQGTVLVRAARRVRAGGAPACVGAELRPPRQLRPPVAAPPRPCWICPRRIPPADDDEDDAA